jgi:ATP-binding cassette, subfamily C, bacterial exporter for protease/lipase
VNGSDSRERNSSLLRQALLACRPQFATAFGFSALANVLFLTPTLYMLIVYSRVIPTKGLGTLAFLSLIGLAALATLAMLDWLRSRLLIKAGCRLDRLLSEPVLTAVLEKPSLTQFERVNALREFDVLRQCLAGGVALVLFDAPWAPVYILAAFLLHWTIGLFCLASAGVLLAITWLNETATRAPLQELNNAAAAAYLTSDQSSVRAPDARALGMTAGLVAQQMQGRAALIELQAKTSFAAANYSSTVRFSRLVMQSAVLALGALLAVKGELSAGAVVAASLLLSRALAPIEQLVGFWKSTVQARGAYQDLNRLLALAEVPPAYTHLPAPRGEVMVEGLTVSAGEGRAPALNNVSFTVAAGQFVGVVGHSGSGKSTLLRILAGAALAPEGVLRIDGAAFAEWEPRRLARHIGYLPQDFGLFPGTIRDNISRFDAFTGEASDLVDTRCIAAAQSAGVHEIILQLPQGYQTEVSPDRCPLSAGQVQRIALARAFYGEPRILVLDEPNAHLDPAGEIDLIRTLDRLKATGVTMLVAAHRGGVLSAAERLLMLTSGRVETFGGLTDLARAMRERTEAEGAERHELQARRA